MKSWLLAILCVLPPSSILGRAPPLRLFPPSVAHDVVTNQVGWVFVPPSPEALRYDADGNLTKDGR